MSAKNIITPSTFTTTLLLVLILLFLFNFNFDAFRAGAAIGPIVGEGTPGFLAKWVTPSPIGYNLSNSGTSNVTKTSSDAFTQNTITKTLVSGATQPVTLSVSGLPSGVSVDGISAQGCSPNCESIITFRVSPSASVGTHLITVTGSPASTNGPTTFNLVISGNPMTVSCSASPSPASIGQTVTWTATVLSGGTSPFTYSWIGTNIPPNITSNTFNISYSTIGQKDATVTVTDIDSVQASCLASVQINFNPQLEEF